MRKTALIAAGVLAAIAAVVVVVVFVFLGFLNSIVKTAIETAGSAATKTKVTVRDVDISVTEGKGTIRGLVLGNPGGYKTPSAMQVDDASIVLDISSVAKNPVVIREVVIVAPQLTYEVGEGGSNIEVIRKNIEGFVGQGGGGKGGQATNSKAPKDKGGATNGEIAEKLIDEITGATSKAITASADVRNLLGDKLPGAARQLLERGGEGVGGALRTILPGQQQQRR
ncbi:MAG: hypothetical protein EXQ85_07970 [Alphaproteobacteria bacterium]|nr:hypothetical protein [Alphaproteobacteria bacterium]